MDAQTLYGALTKNDETDRWTIRDDISEDLHDEVQSIIYSLHDNGAILPDDYRYRFIAEAVSALAEGWTIAEIEVSDPDDLFPYNGDRLAWLSSRLDRVGYVDDARYENDDYSTMEMIGLGMMREYREVARSLVSILDDGK